MVHCYPSLLWMSVHELCISFVRSHLEDWTRKVAQEPELLTLEEQRVIAHWNVLRAGTNMVVVGLNSFRSNYISDAGKMYAHEFLRHLRTLELVSSCESELGIELLKLYTKSFKHRDISSHMYDIFHNMMSFFKEHQVRFDVCKLSDLHAALKLLSPELR